jgi:hypothetical protein
MLFGQTFAEYETAVAVDLDNAAAILLFDLQARISRKVAGSQGQDIGEGDPQTDYPTNKKNNKSFGEDDLMSMIFEGGGGLPFNR